MAYLKSVLFKYMYAHACCDVRNIKVQSNALTKNSPRGISDKEELM